MEGGEDRGTKLLPGLSADEIADFERACGCTFTPEIRELLGFCGGFEEGPMEIIEFKGEMFDPIPSLAGRICHIAPDGFGNFWFHWVPHITANLGPIYYYQHEGPMLIYQSPSMVDFVSECLRFMTPPFSSLIDDVHEFRLKPVQELNRELRSKDSLLTSPDPVIRDFLAPLPNQALICDFRNARPGDGVDLMKMDITALHPTLPILALQPRRSLFGRLTSLFGSQKK